MEGHCPQCPIQRLSGPWGHGPSKQSPSLTRFLASLSYFLFEALFARDEISQNESGDGAQGKWAHHDEDAEEVVEVPIVHSTGLKGLLRLDQACKLAFLPKALEFFEDSLPDLQCIRLSEEEQATEVNTDRDRNSCNDCCE